MEFLGKKVEIPKFSIQHPELKGIVPAVDGIVRATTHNSYFDLPMVFVVGADFDVWVFKRDVKIV